MVLRPGFEPGSGDRESPMLGRTTHGNTMMILIAHLPELIGTNPERECSLRTTNKAFPAKGPFEAV